MLHWKSPVAYAIVITLVVLGAAGGFLEFEGYRWG